MATSPGSPNSQEPLATLTVDFGDGPLAISEQQLGELRAGRGISLPPGEREAPHPEFSDYAASASDEDIIAGEDAQADAEERGDVPVFEPPRDPNAPEWRAYCEQAKAWRRNPCGPRPTPPPRPSIRQHPGFREHLRSVAEQRRQAIRALRRRVALRRTPTRAAVASLQAPRRTSGPTRPAARRPVRRSSGSRGDPPGGEEGDQAPVDEVAVQTPAESLLWRLRFWWNPDPWAIREAPLGLWRVRVWHVRRLEAKGLLP